MSKSDPWDNLPEAEYFEAALPEYEGNPLITTLGPVLESAGWARKLNRPPILLPLERDYPPNLRSECIFRLQDFFVPLTMHLELAPAIASLIRRGYVGRNPMTPWRKRMLHLLYDAAEQDELPTIPDTLRQRASSIAVLGTSGSGKTTSINAILKALGHQVRRHKKYGFIQIAWLKFDCPPDKDRRSLALAFFAQIDALVHGSNLTARYADSNIPTTRLLVKMIALCIEYNLGALVIDEIHNLGAKASDEVNELLNFLKSMYNELGVPIIYCGTRKALDILGADFQNLRRTMDAGMYEFDRLYETDSSYPFLMDGMGDFQWLKKAQIPLPENVRHSIYQESQGIFSLIVALYILSQIRAIATRQEMLTPEIIHQVASDRFTALIPKLDALRRGDTQMLEEIGDLLPVNFKNLYSTEQRKLGRMREERIKMDSELQRLGIRNQVKAFLMKTGRKDDYAESLLDEAMGKTTVADFVTILEAVLTADQRIHLENPQPAAADRKSRPAAKSKAVETPQPATVPLPPDPLDLRGLSKVKEKGDQADIEAMRAAGLVSNPAQDFTM